MINHPILAQDCHWLQTTYPELFTELEGKDILLTGAAGFLGAYFLDIFAHYNMAHGQNPIRVFATDNYLSANPARLEAFNGVPGITLCKHSVMEPLPTHAPRFDYIIHGASVASPIFYRQYPIETIEANVIGTWNLLKRAQTDASKAILVFSSSEIYGDPATDKIPTAEDYWGNVSCLGPRACYDESKRLGETLAYNFYHQHQVPAKIVRPFNVYGPGQRLNDGRIIPDLLAAAVEGRDIVLYSDGTPTRSFCYVRDFMAGTLLVMIKGAPAEPYNVGNDEELSMRHVAELMTEVAAQNGKSLGITFAKSAEAAYLTHNPNRRCPNLGKMEKAFGWRPQVMVKEGLARTLSTYLSQPHDEAAA